MHDLIDYNDRQDTIETIYALASDVKEGENPRIWLQKLEEIKEAASEFIW